MRIGLLGPLHVESNDGVVLPLRGLRLRTLMALLTTRNGEVVTSDEIIDALWPDGGPTLNAVHVLISKLRRALTTGDDAAPLQTVDRGYVLAAAPQDIDIVRFEQLAHDGATTLLDGRHEEALTMLEEALDLWRGPALGEFTNVDFAVLERHRLDEVRAIAREHRVDALIEAGRHELVVAELEEAVMTNPLRERVWAQLMLALYRSGRQADALRAFGRARHVLIDEVGVEPGVALRELEQRILQQHADLELRAAAPQPDVLMSAAPAYVTNVKQDLSSLVGRGADLDALGEVLAQRRLVSIIGPGGVGKTRLASELARRRAAAWGHGAWMLELDVTSGPDGVARPLLTAFAGHPDATTATVDLSTAIDTAAATIGGAAMLLVLDNCEHVLGEVRTVASALLQRCPELRILTTSRVVLDVVGETVRQLEPLPIDDAVTLFAARGVDAQHRFVVGDDDGTVRSICERVDCLPLGIELAAARLRAFTPKQLDTQLAERLASVAATSGSREPRHRTLPATVGWSYGLLFDPEQSLLRALSVFRGTFALDAVEAVATNNELTAGEVADTLARLVDKSLVVAERGDREPRYRLLRTVGDFAAAAADDHDETAGLRRRHAVWVAQLAARSRDGFHGSQQAQWAARLRDDVANIDAALSFARGGGDVDLGLRTCADLAWFALTTTSLPSTLDHMLTLLQLDDLGTGTRARALAWASVIGAGMASAARMATEAVDLARSLTDNHVLAEALIVTGMPLSRRVSTADMAIAHAREGRVLAMRTDQDWLVAASYAVEGGARALTPAGLTAAVDLLERAGRIYTDLGDRYSAEINAWYLSQAHEDRGDIQRAQAVLAPYTSDTVDSAGTILNVSRLAWLAERTGDTAQSAAHAQRLTATTAVHQRRLFWGAAQFAIGNAALSAGNLSQARSALTAALGMHTDIGFERSIVLELALLGELAQREGHDGGSIELHNEAIRRGRELTLPLPHVIALERAAQSALRREAPTDAISFQTQATSLRATARLAPTGHEQALARDLLDSARRVQPAAPPSHGSGGHP